MRKAIALSTLIVLLSVSCSSDKKEHISAFEPDNEEESTVFAEKADNESQETANSTSSISVSAIETVEENVNEINSPDKLMEHRYKIESEIANLSAKIAKASNSEEKARLSARLNQLQTSYHQKEREYLLPANGIVDNIRNLTSRLEKCQSKDEFMKILEPRFSYFKNLTKVHTLVEEPNRRQDVREMAEALNVLFQKKKAQFGVEF